jgi:coenzyme F420-reducing hydrogenase beta subunit
MDFDRFGQLKPQGSRQFLRQRTQSFARACPFSPHAKNEDDLAERFLAQAPRADPHLGRFSASFVGHAGPRLRAAGSSGGMVSWFALSLLRSGEIDAVAHVAGDGRPGQSEPMFAYRLSRTEDELLAGARSRYFPVEMSQVLHEIRQTPGRYAVIGLPCFIKAVQLIRDQDPLMRERITWTLGLFCGHMKSARMADSFAWQLGVRPSQLEYLEYRHKDPSRPAHVYTVEARLMDGEVRRKDWWNLVDGDWGAGFFQNAACDLCDDVAAETADVAFGDAWAEPYATDGRGTNVVVARSPAAEERLRKAMATGDISLETVEPAFVVATQAAGFRQRREGLAHRLTWPGSPVRPAKRVAPRLEPDFHRRRLYDIRARISRWSHRMMWLARRLNWPGLYLGWAGVVLAIYHGAAYGRGPLRLPLAAYDWLRGRSADAPSGPA